MKVWNSSGKVDDKFNSTGSNFGSPSTQNSLKGKLQSLEVLPYSDPTKRHYRRHQQAQKRSRNAQD
jgi:hypothetical protein